MQDIIMNSETESSSQVESASEMKLFKSQKLVKRKTADPFEETELERKQKTIEETECPRSPRIDVIEVSKNELASDIETWLDQSHKLDWSSHITDFFRTVSSSADFSRTSSAA